MDIGIQKTIKHHEILKLKGPLYMVYDIKWKWYGFNV